MPDHSFDLAALILKLDLTVEDDPAVPHPGLHLAVGHVHVPFQDVRNGLAISESSRGSPGSRTSMSLATAFTP
jgi:hypothetical protein